MENERISFLRQYIGKNMQQNFSPVAQWLNGKLLNVEEGMMQIEYLVRPDMCNPMGTLHGGMAATILDEIVGTMVFALGREYAFTSVNLNCDFLNPAFPGDVLTAHANIVRVGKNIIHVEGRLTAAEGKIIAKCASNLIQTSFQIPALVAN
ncbi:PaaI family thioesterase [Dyadobacter sp.]|uniref:PaaI family thioesterase n=1 Tax=Dyadobacter sp. TaxID=1914288 RepID=UPI003F730552